MSRIFFDRSHKNNDHQMGHSPVLSGIFFLVDHPNQSTKGIQMNEYTITATLTKTYEIKVKAADPAAAIAMLDDWISDDFEEFETAASWTMEAK